MGVVRYETESDWLKARHNGIGASEVAAILGLSRFSSPWSIWRDKVDKPTKTEPPSPMAEWGHRHEEAIARKFAEVCGLATWVVHEAAPYQVWHLEDSILFATPDRTLGENVVLPVPQAPLEIKCAWYKAATEWEERIPLAYRCQLQTQMHCMGVEKGYYAVLLNGYDFRWYWEAYDANFMASVQARCEKFWRDYVEPKISPPTDYSDATREALSSHFSEPKEVEVDLPEYFQEIHEQRQDLKESKATVEQKIAGHDNEIKATLGNATVGRLPDGSCYMWRPTKKGTRVLRHSRGESHGSTD